MRFRYGIFRILKRSCGANLPSQNSQSSNINNGSISRMHIIRHFDVLVTVFLGALLWLINLARMNLTSVSRGDAWWSSPLSSQSLTTTSSNNKNSCSRWDIEEFLFAQEGTFQAKDDVRDRWARLINEATTEVLGDDSVGDKDGAKTTFLRGAEIGVYKGEFAQVILKKVPSVQEYVMVDSWRHLDDWNRPFNKDDASFQRAFIEAMEQTKYSNEFGHKVKVLRMTSAEAASLVEDESLDFIYLDADHTAKGAMKDLLLWGPKVKCGGLIFGDDYYDSSLFMNMNNSNKKERARNRSRRLKVTAKPGGLLFSSPTIKKEVVDKKKEVVDTKKEAIDTQKEAGSGKVVAEDSSSKYDPIMVKSAVTAYAEALGISRVYDMGHGQFGFVKRITNPSYKK